jgi:ABC-2 type transport system ATP-binding protein
MERRKQPLLQCIHLSKQKGEFVLEDINFALEPGYILGVIGRNGSGKSTLLRTLLGSYCLTMPYEKEFQSRKVQADQAMGDIQLNGVSIKEQVVQYKEQIAYVLNDTPFPLWMNTKDCGRVYGNYYRSFDRAKYVNLLKNFEVPEKISLKYLSKGQQIKQQLAFALSYEAKLYLLDEPAGNLDVEFRETFYRHIRSLIADSSKGIIYASHLVEELEQLADYILWIGGKKENDSEKKGIQRFFGSLEDLRKKFQLVEANREEASEIQGEVILGIRERENHQEMLVQIPRDKLSEPLRRISRYATLKEIMYYIEKGVKEHETDFFRNMD